MNLRDKIIMTTMLVWFMSPVLIVAALRNSHHQLAFDIGMGWAITTLVIIMVGALWSIWA